jgi:serine protease Do
MKSIIKIILVSALGGFISLGTYKLFFEKPEVRTYIETQASNEVKPANYSRTAPALDFVMAAEKSINSVVHVKTAVRAVYNQVQSPLNFFFGSPQKGQKERMQLGTGSGVIISSDGYIVTNNHVIDKAEEILVSLNSGEDYKAIVIGADPTTDIALLKIVEEVSDLPYLSFSNSDNIRVGEWVLAVGNPFNLTSTVTAGIVSAKARNIGIIDERAAIESFIQTDAAVNPGNSGGALVNTRGELVGINSAISTHTGSFEGYSFAVPSNLASKVVRDLKEYGTVQRAFIGVNISDLNQRLADDLDVNVNAGVYIGGLSENGAAEEAGLEKGDIILAVNSRNISKSSELQEIIGSKRPGEKISLKVLRDNAERDFEVILRNVNGTTKRIKKEDLEFLSLLGGRFREINAQEKNSYRLKYGVKILEINNGILAEQDIPTGFIITQINQQAV